MLGSNPVPFTDYSARLIELPAPQRPAVTADVRDDSVGCFIDEVASQLGADGSILTWSQPGLGRPLLVSSGGVCAEDHLLEGYVVDHAPAAMAGWNVCRAPDVSGRWSEVQVDGRPWSILSLTIAAEEGAALTVNAVFTRAGELLRKNTEEITGRLCPLLGGFLKLWVTRALLRQRLAGLASALNQSDMGVVLLDRRRRTIFANTTATELLDSANGLRRNGPSLTATDLADALRLQVAIDHMIGTGGDDVHAAGAPIVALRRSRRLRPLMVSVLPPERAPQSDRDVAAILYVFNPDQDVQPLLRPACKLYGLSPVETNLTCLLASGASLSEAASEIHVKEQTARTYLKQIFLKTDTRRQAELVRLMLSSIVRTHGAEAQVV